MTATPSVNDDDKSPANASQASSQDDSSSSENASSKASEKSNASEKSKAPEKSKAMGILTSWLLRLVVIAAIPGVLGIVYLFYRNHAISDLKAACKENLAAEHWEDLERDALSWYSWQSDLAEPLILAATAAEQRENLLNAAIYLSRLPDKPESVIGLLKLSEMEYDENGLNRPRDAAITWKRILAVDPTHREAHRRLAFFYAMSRQRKELLAEVRRAIKAGGDVPATYVHLFGADWMTFTNGADVNRRWLLTYPNDEMFTVAESYHFTRSAGFAESVQETDENGVSVLERRMVDLLGVYKDNVELLSYHIDLAMFRSDIDNVTFLLKQATAESADDSRFWRYKGWVHQSRQEYDEAIAAYEKCLELYAYDQQAHLKLAEVYRRLKNMEAVAKHQQLSELATEIRRVTFAMPNIDGGPPELLTMMEKYARLAGETEVADRLQMRMEQQQEATEPATSAPPA